VCPSRYLGESHGTLRVPTTSECHMSAPSQAGELAFRAKFLRVACLVNAALFLLLVGGGTLLLLTVARATGAHTPASGRKGNPRGCSTRR